MTVTSQKDLPDVHEHRHPQEVGTTEASSPPSAPGSVVLDIGPGASVIIIRTGPEVSGREIEIRRAAEPWSGRHMEVRPRTGIGPPQYAAVFGSLEDGRYEFRILGHSSPEVHAAATVQEGSIAVIDWG